MIYCHHNHFDCLQLPVSWFWDSCKCDQCYDSSHYFRRTPHPVALPDTVKGQDIDLDLSQDGTVFCIKSPAFDGHKAVISAEDIEKLQSSSLASDVTLRSKSYIHLWSGSEREFDRNLAKVSYLDFVESESGLKDGLRKFRQYGFLVVGDCPPEDFVVPTLAKRVAYIRDSSFGQVADVKVGPQSAIHPSYRGEPLSLHTDLTYREKSPGILMLHFLKTADPDSVGPDLAGGQTQLSDGFKTAYELKKINPEAFNILTKVWIPFCYRDPLSGLVYRNIQRTILIDPLGSGLVSEIHYSNFARQPQLSTGTSGVSLVEFYRALSQFSDLLVKNQIQFYARPGETYLLNNRRVLHARTAFDASRVERYMRTCYIDLDEVEAKVNLVLGLD